METCNSLVVDADQTTAANKSDGDGEKRNAKGRQTPLV
jgi:hypothetical protein